VSVIGCGTVFRLSPSAGGWTETILHDLQLRENNMPTDPVSIGPDGALYGDVGIEVFRLEANAEGVWHKRAIFTFPGGVTGTAPEGGVIFDPAGNIYGATRSFGINGPAFVYALSPPVVQGEPWVETTLATIASSFDSPQPVRGLTRGPDGTLYGVVELGSGQFGYIFEVTP
jgi:hypothetical protein